MQDVSLSVSLCLSPSLSLSLCLSFFSFSISYECLSLSLSLPVTPSLTNGVLFACMAVSACLILFSLSQCLLPVCFDFQRSHSDA